MSAKPTPTKSTQAAPRPSAEAVGKRGADAASKKSGEPAPKKHGGGAAGGGSGAITSAQARALATAGELDYAAIGFRCGLEIHQQLDSRKLFSLCPSEVVDPDEVTRRAVARYDRRLRATQSELGETDAAATAEARRRRSFSYLAIDGLTSLVELDEEPPHRMSDEALGIVLTFAGLVGATPADEVHVMRKTVIDGSNTSGFQRTALVATGGRIDAAQVTGRSAGSTADGDAGTGPGANVAGGSDPAGGPVGSGEAGVGIWTIAVEEDSARKLEEEAGRVTYTLDRLGIPLIEVATAPDITDPQHAKATAARLGALLRATGRVKRGLGTIRQDLNVSVGVGDRVEIKGCQDLRAVPRVIENECRRQLWMHHIRQELHERGFGEDDVGPVEDVSSAFSKTSAKLVQAALKRGQGVLALRLGKWAGLIGGATAEGPRMGREFADHAKVAAHVKGVFHSDELPAYGIQDAEVESVRRVLELGPEDGFVLCVESPDVAKTALEAVAERARAAVGPLPREVRAAQPDDSTRYMRPLPGAARMYPETDVPPIRISREHWQEVLASLPPRPEEKVGLLAKGHGLSRDVAEQLVRDGSDADFTAWVEQGVDAGLAARVLLQFLPGFAHPDRVRSHVPGVAAALREGRFAKEAVPGILAALDQDAGAGLEAAIEAAGAAALADDEVDAIIQGVVGERIDFVKERGMAAVGPLMGPVMAKLRGRVDGAVVSSKLKAAIEQVAG